MEPIIVQEDTDKLEKVITLAGQVKSKVDAARADGKVTAGEMFSILPEIMAIPEIIEAGKEINEERKDLDIIEIIDLSEKATKELVPNESKKFQKAFKYTLITVFSGQVAGQSWINFSKEIDTTETP